MSRTLTDLGLIAPGQRCECRGICGREHLRGGDGRCDVTDHPARPLILTVPGDSAASIAWLPRERLTVLCQHCAHAAEQASRRARAEHVHAAEATGPNLLDLLAQEASA